MSPTLPSAAPWSGRAASPDSFRVIRKRNRVPLSCGPCRHRKLKCNRQSPCDNCTKRGDASSCAYAAPVPRKKGSQNSAGANATPDDMQNRIDRLESLVLSLVSSGSSSAANATSTATTTIGSGSLGPNLDTDPNFGQYNDGDDDGNDNDNDDDDDDGASETERVTKSFGILKVDSERQKTLYIGEAHWAALLHEIGEVKTHFAQHKKEYDEQREKVAKNRDAVGSDAGAGPALLFSASKPASRAEILGQIPPRRLSDVLINRYFNTFDPAIHIIHPPAFYRQYNAFWQDPANNTSIVWIAMLFAMMRLAMISYFREGERPPELQGECLDMAANFRTQMAHCLITADYTKPHNHIIETLIFHLHAEYISNRDSEASVWVLVGMIARLAMRMGYHRDPKFFPALTPFEGEMRRRIWTFVRSSDLLFSFQVALPPMIRIGDSDTDLPSNLLDDDLDEDSPTMPPSRPNDEPTPVSYMITKGRLVFGFGRVLEAISGLSRKGYDEVLKIDRGLREIYDGIPDYLKLKSTNDTKVGTASLIMARFSLAIIYHKSQCVLHGRYMRQARGNNRFVYSRRTALDSAMHLLQYQVLQHRATLERDRRKKITSHVNSLATHDFSLAATVLCVDLYNHHERQDNTNNNNSDVSTPGTSVSGGSVSGGSSSTHSDTGVYVAGLPYSRGDMLRTLEQSREVYQASRDLSLEAYKAYELLSLLLQHLRSSPTAPQPPHEEPRPGSGTTHSNFTLGGGGGGGGGGPNATTTTATSQDEQSAAFMLGVLQSGALGQQDQGLTTSVPPAQLNGQWDTADKIGSVLGVPDDSLQFSALFPSTGGMGVPGQFPTSVFSGIGDGGGAANINLDWEMWDQYMQGANIPALDPAANLWGDDGPSPQSNSNSNDHLFTRNASSSSQSPASYFGPSLKASSDSKQDSDMTMPMPTLSADMANVAAASRDDSTVGQVFMGVPSPQPEGIPNWK